MVVDVVENLIKKLCVYLYRLLVIKVMEEYMFV